MIINLSNHPHKNWQEKQIRAANAYGEIIDLPFPQISPYADEEELELIASQLLQKIREMKPNAVIVMGEFSLSFMIVDALLDDGIPILTSASSRVVNENKAEDGTVVKTAHFDFVLFRQYKRLKKKETGSQAADTVIPQS
ncbi:MAG: hypothetical protein IJQ63_03575 [Synergistaceae bacterium]|nr:hypothetical protein [Synergistaceae bacterium]